MKRARTGGDAPDDASTLGAKRAKVDGIITQLMPSLVTSAAVWRDHEGDSWSWMVSSERCPWHARITLHERSSWQLADTFAGQWRRD